MSGPGLAGFRLDMREAGTRRRVRNADEDVASGTLNLSAGMARVALQRLIAVRTIEFEFGRFHRLFPDLSCADRV